MRDWMKYIPAAETQFYKKAGFLGDMQPGRRTGLVVVDVTMGFCGAPGLSLDDAYDTGWTGKATKNVKRDRATPAGYNDFPEMIKPREQDWVLAKTKASAFFQTPLSAYLIREGVDTLVFCGVSTSGCVRATVVDGFSHGFRSFVVDECCFDRSEFAHAANLFDMNAKYAAVVSVDEVETMMTGVKLAAAE